MHGCAELQLKGFTVQRTGNTQLAHPGRINGYPVLRARLPHLLRVYRQFSAARLAFVRLSDLHRHQAITGNFCYGREALDVVLNNRLGKKHVYCFLVSRKLALLYHSSDGNRGLPDDRKVGHRDQ
jgi:hypothetical protein